MKHPAARTALGDLHRATPWLWLYSEKCSHSSPLACAVVVIRWGAETSSHKLRRSARCTACGHKGATIQRPSWGGTDVLPRSFGADRRSGLDYCGAKPIFNRDVGNA
jgi:hypothetical protein